MRARGRGGEKLLTSGIRGQDERGLGGMDQISYLMMTSRADGDKANSFGGVCMLLAHCCAVSVLVVSKWGKLDEVSDLMQLMNSSCSTQFHDIVYICHKIELRLLSSDLMLHCS